MQKRALLLYSTNDGQTKKIMEFIANQLDGHFACDVRDLLHGSEISWQTYQRVVIGAAVRYGRFDRRLLEFIKRHQTALRAIPSSFFCVCLLARKPEKRTAHTNAYLRKFLRQSPWQPTIHSAFAGALLYPRYSWFDRTLIRLIMLLTGGATDPRIEVEYTDWQQVQSFCDQFRQLTRTVPQDG